MTTWTNPLSIVLRTDIYRLDVSAPNCYETGGYFFIGTSGPPYSGGLPGLNVPGSGIFPAQFRWMGFSEYFGLPLVNKVEWLAAHPLWPVFQYYTSYSYAVTVNTVRTYTITNGGLSVSDSQVTTAVTLTMSQPPIPNLAYDSADPALISSYSGGSPVSPYVAVPSSYTVTYTAATYATLTGGGSLPQGAPALYNSGFSVNAQSPSISIDQSDSFTTIYSGSPVSVNKIAGNKLLPQINQGGSIDPQSGPVTFGNGVESGQYLLNNWSPIVQYKTTSTSYGSFSEETEVGPMYYFGGVANTDFGLLLDRPNVPLGTLTCTDVAQGSFPIVPPLVIPANPAGALFSSVATNVDSWSGYRYLKLNARILGFSTTIPLPRILLGIVPTSEVNESVCASALGGSPTFGIWYEVDVTTQGTAGQIITTDLAKPIKGSGTWLTNEGNVSIPGPLGAGAFTNNPIFPNPGGTLPVSSGLGALSGATMAAASLVVSVDGGSVQTVGSASITISDFALLETTGCSLSINVNASENLPVVPSQAIADVETSSPNDGTLLTVTRDGKVAVAVRVYESPTGGANLYPESCYSNLLSWSTFFSGLNALGNGFAWSFSPLYTNFMSGGEEVCFFLPVPSKWPVASFKAGGSVNIPIAARCTSYSSSCPWVDLGSNGLITGDDPVLVDDSNVSILCLSDYIGTLAGIPCSVQSGRIGPGEVVALASGQSYGTPVPTTDYGPTTLTPDVNGVINISVGAPASYEIVSATEDAEAFAAVTSGGPYTVTFEQAELSPQIDGYFITFDEGLAKGQSTATGKLMTVYVPVRNGEFLALPYTVASSGGPAEIDTGYVGRPLMDRSTIAAFCLRASVRAVTKYSEPRAAFWRIASDNKGRIVATLVCGFYPYPTSSIKYPVRAGAWVMGLNPNLAIHHARMIAVYRRQDNKWVSAITDDQFTTLGEEVVLFNQPVTGDVNVEYDESTSSQWYVASLRADSISWVAAVTTPEPSSNPGAMPQVAVIRRRDGSGASLPFTLASGAGLTGPLWENIVYFNQPSGGQMGLQVLPTGTVVIACGTEMYQSTDNGTTWTDPLGNTLQALSNQTSGELQSGANGGTENPT